TDNISLLGTLFQYQSDKNGVMDVNEATEFSVSLFTAIDIAEDMYNFMEDEGCIMNESIPMKEARFEPTCFRANFWKALCTNYRKYYPLMFNSMHAPAKCE